MTGRTQCEWDDGPKAISAALGADNHASQAERFSDQPPRLIVALNDTPVLPDREASDRGQDVPGATLDDRAKLYEPATLEAVLAWITTRLEAGLAETWKGDAGRNEEFPPDTEEEAWARTISEMFLCLPYGGPGIAYRFPRFKKNPASADLLIFQRIQKQYWSEEDLIALRKMRSRGKVEPNWAPQNVIQNDDPAYSVVVACEHLATYGSLTRGFTMEEDLLCMGYSAGQVGDREIFSKPGGQWYGTKTCKSEKEKDALRDPDKIAALDTPVRPGSVFTYNPYGDKETRKVYMPASQAYKTNKAGKQVPNVPNLAAESRNVSKVKEEQGRAVFDDADRPQPPNPEETATCEEPFIEVEAPLTGQLQGSHIAFVLRVYQRKLTGKTVLQLLDTSAGRSLTPTTDAHDIVKALGHTCTYDSNLVDQIHKGTVFVGLGVPPPPVALGQHVDSVLRKARPIGLARLALVERPRRKGGGLIDSDLLYASRLLRTYAPGDDQNYSFARYLGSLRNLPWYKDIQAFWVTYIPRGDLAVAVWAVGARERSLQQIQLEVTRTKRARWLWTKAPPRPPRNPYQFKSEVDYLPAAVFTVQSNGLVSYVWRMHAAGAAGGDKAHGQVPNLIKNKLMSAPNTANGALGWNQEYFHPSLQHAGTGEAVVVPDYFADLPVPSHEESDEVTNMLLAEADEATSAGDMSTPEDEWAWDNEAVIV